MILPDVGTPVQMFVPSSSNITTLVPLVQLCLYILAGYSALVVAISVFLSVLTVLLGLCLIRTAPWVASVFLKLFRKAKNAFLIWRERSSSENIYTTSHRDRLPCFHTEIM